MNNICKQCKYYRHHRWVKEQKRFALFECGMANSTVEKCINFKPKWYLRINPKYWNKNYGK